MCAVPGLLLVAGSFRLIEALEVKLKISGRRLKFR